jgi:hypothetical protein
MTLRTIMLIVNLIGVMWLACGCGYVILRTTRDGDLRSVTCPDKVWQEVLILPFLLWLVCIFLLYDAIILILYVIYKPVVTRLYQL